MARRQQQTEDDLLMEDELAAAFLEDETTDVADESQMADELADDSDDWAGEEPAGQLAVDVYETKEKLVVRARVAGVDKNDLDVSIADNTLSIHGTLTSGDVDEAENHFVQECYWGEFSRTLALPVSVKEDEIDAVLKDGVLTISFTKLQQDTVKKIEIK